jgi:hypothetical protein
LTEGQLHIEIVCARPRRAIVKAFTVAAGACVADALRLAALDPDFGEVDLEGSAVGIFGRAAPANEVLSDGDRIEIYRPLAADPKAARRARAKASRGQ